MNRKLNADRFAGSCELACLIRRSPVCRIAADAGVARLKTLRSNHSRHVKMDCALVNSTTELGSMTPTMSNGHTAPRAHSRPTGASAATTGHPVVSRRHGPRVRPASATEVDRQHHLDVERSRPVCELSP